MIRPVSIPLEAWFKTLLKDKELNKQYYQAVDIDPYIECLEKIPDELNGVILEMKKNVEVWKEHAKGMPDDIRYQYAIRVTAYLDMIDVLESIIVCGEQRQ